MLNQQISGPLDGSVQTTIVSLLTFLDTKSNTALGERCRESVVLEYNSSIHVSNNEVESSSGYCRYASEVCSSAIGPTPAHFFMKPGTIKRVALPKQTSEDETRQGWTFLTNHGHVLVCIAGDPGIRGRDIATRVGVTERATQAIIADLVEGGYVKRTRIGRRNHYEINPERPLRHPVEQPHSVGELLQLVAGLVPSKRRKVGVS